MPIIPFFTINDNHDFDISYFAIHGLLSLVVLCRTASGKVALSPYLHNATNQRVYITNLYSLSSAKIVAIMNIPPKSINCSKELEISAPAMLDAAYARSKLIRAAKIFILKTI